MRSPVIDMPEADMMLDPDTSTDGTAKALSGQLQRLIATSDSGSYRFPYLIRQMF
jgi:hypothetical protein